MHEIRACEPRQFFRALNCRKSDRSWNLGKPGSGRRGSARRTPGCHCRVRLLPGRRRRVESRHKHESLRRLAHARLGPALRVCETETNAGLVDGVKARWRAKPARPRSCERSGIHHRQRPDAGRASLAVDGCLASSRAGDRFCHFGHRPSTVGHSREGAGAAGLQVAGRTFDLRACADITSASAALARKLPARDAAPTRHHVHQNRHPDTTNGSNARGDQARRGFAGTAPLESARDRYWGRFPCEDQSERRLDPGQGPSRPTCCL